MPLIRLYKSSSKAFRCSFCGGVLFDLKPKFESVPSLSFSVDFSKKCAFHLRRFKKLSTFSIRHFKYVFSLGSGIFFNE